MELLGEQPLGYVIAAYAIGVGTLVVYGTWIQLQRRALQRRDEESRGSGDRAG